MDIDFDTLRGRMITEQLIGRGIQDEKVLAAFGKVPRHEFVPPRYSVNAYGDHPLPIGNEQTISQPYMVALMTECLGLKGGEKVFEVGTGSGYQTAILAEIAGEVYSIERLGGIAAVAKETLSRLGYKNCFITSGDGTEGLVGHAPYDGILVTAGSPGIPNSLTAQLKDGARLVIPVGGEFGQMLTVVERSGDSFVKREVCGCTFVPIIGKEGLRK